MDALTPVQRFFRLLAIDRKDIYYIYLYALFAGLITLAIPLGFQAIIGLLAAGTLSNAWWILVAVVVIGTSLPGVLKVMQLTVTEMIVRRIFARSALDIAYRLPNLKTESILTRYAPELVNRFFDTLTIQKGLPKLLIEFSTALLQIIFGLLLLSFYHPFFVFFSLVLLLFLGSIFIFTSPAGLRTSIKESTNKYQVAYWLEELARAQRSFQATGADNYPLMQTDEKVNQYLHARHKHFKILVLQYYLIVAFKILITVALLIIGGKLVVDNQINIGQFVAAEIIVILIMNSAEKLILGMETVYDVLTALEKLGELVDLPIEGKEQSGYTVEEIESLRINKLQYVFPDTNRPSLAGVSLSFSPGEKVCIAGTSGSGKSTFLKILAGQISGYQGQVLINGIPLQNLNISRWRQSVGTVSAQSDIFRGSILENITMGEPNIQIEDVTRIVSGIGLSEFVEQCQGGYAHELLPEGRNVPRSVRTKILLARSMAQRPKLLLFEDFLSHLTVAERQQLIEFLVSYHDKSIMLAVSDDPLVARAADRVVVLKDGQLAADAHWNQLPAEMKALFIPAHYFDN